MLLADPARTFNEECRLAICHDRAGHDQSISFGLAFEMAGGELDGGGQGEPLAEEMLPFGKS